MSSSLSNLVAIAVLMAALVGVVGYSKGAAAGFAAGAITAVLVGLVFGAELARVAEERGWTMDDRAQFTTPRPVRRLTIALIVLTILALVGLEMHNEIMTALEQCAPNCELRG